MRILSNKAQCKLCGDVVESNIDAKQYLYCKCNAIAVSGGYEAIMRLGHHNNILELSKKDYSI